MQKLVMSGMVTVMVLAAGTARAQSPATPAEPAGAPKLELELGYQFQKEYEGETLNGGALTVVFVNRSPVSFVVRAAGLYRNDDSRHFSGTVPVEVDGYTRMLLGAVGGRLEGRLGPVVPYAQVLAGVLHKAEKQTTYFNGDVLQRNRSAFAIVADASAGLKVNVTSSFGVYGNAGFTPIIGGFDPAIYGYQLSAGMSFSFRD